MGRYIKFTTLYDSVLISVQAGDYLAFCHHLEQLTMPLSFYGYLSVKEAQSFRLFILENKNIAHMHAILRRLHYCFSKEYEFENEKAIKKTKAVLSHLKHKGYWWNKKVTDLVFNPYLDNSIYVCNHPKRYFVITKKHNCLEYLGKWIEVYDWKFKMLKNYRFQNKKETGDEYIKNNRLYIRNETKGTISVINPYSLELDPIDEIKLPRDCIKLHEDEIDIYYSLQNDDRVIYRMNKENSRSIRYAELADSVTVDFTDNFLLVHYRIGNSYHYLDKLPRVRPDAFSYTGKKMKNGKYKLYAFLIETLVKVCFYDDPIMLRYLIDEEINRFSKEETNLSIRFLRELINRLCELKIEKEENKDSLMNTLALLENYGFDSEEDLCGVLIGLMDCVRYPLFNGNHPTQLFSNRFFDCLRVIIRESKKSKKEIKEIIKNDPNELFKDFYRWKPDDKKLIHFYVEEGKE